MKWNIIAVAYIVVVIAIAQIVSPKTYHWVQHTISQYAAQNYRYQWIMQLGFVGFGVLLTIGVFTSWSHSRELWYIQVPILVYGLSIAASAVFSTEPFIEGVSYSETEAQLHSFFAFLAGISFSIAILMYGLTEPVLWKKVTHFAVLAVVLILSMGVGNISAYAGLLQRLLWLVSFGWLVFLYQPIVD